MASFAIRATSSTDTHASRAEGSARITRRVVSRNASASGSMPSDRSTATITIGAAARWRCTGAAPSAS